MGRPAAKCLAHGIVNGRGTVDAQDNAEAAPLEKGENLRAEQSPVGGDGKAESGERILRGFNGGSHGRKV